MLLVGEGSGRGRLGIRLVLYLRFVVVRVCGFLCCIGWHLWDAFVFRQIPILVLYVTWFAFEILSFRIRCKVYQVCRFLDEIWLSGFWAWRKNVEGVSVYLMMEVYPLGWRAVVPPVPCRPSRAAFTF